MVIYADILVLVNLYIDYFLLLGVKRFLHLQVRTGRMILGSLLGGFSGLLGLLPLPFAASLLLLLFSGGGICFAAFWNRNLNRCLKATACFFAFSLMFSGLIALMIRLFGVPAALVGGRVYFDLSPLLLLLFTVLAYLCALLLERLRGRREPGSSFCRVMVEQQGNRTELFCKIDTGSDLHEPFSGLPVLVAEASALQELLPRGMRDCRPERGDPLPPGVRLVPYSSLGGAGLLPAFRPEKIWEKRSGTPLNCYLAVAPGALSAAGCRALISPEALEFL